MFLSRDSLDFTEYVPKSGSVLVFDHELFHEGALLKEGVKYAIRTDVMYRRQGGSDWRSLKAAGVDVVREKM